MKFVAMAVPLAIAPLLALQAVTAPLQPYQQIGWAWRLLCSLLLTVFLIGALGALGWLAFSRSSARALLTLCLIFFAPPLAYQAVGAANVIWDHRSGVAVTVACLGYVHRTKGLSYLEVTSWHDPSKTVEIDASFVRENRCAPQQPVRLLVHPGRLGWEWITPQR